MNEMDREQIKRLLRHYLINLHGYDPDGYGEINLMVDSIFGEIDSLRNGLDTQAENLEKRVRRLEGQIDSLVASSIRTWQEIGWLLDCLTEHVTDDPPAWMMGQDPHRCDKCGSTLIDKGRVVICPRCDTGWQLIQNEHPFVDYDFYLPDAMYGDRPNAGGRLRLTLSCDKEGEPVGAYMIVVLDSGSCDKIVLEQQFAIPLKWALKVTGYGKED